MRKFLLLIMLLLSFCGFGLALPAYGENSQSIKPVRAVHFVLRTVSVDDAKHMADLAKKYGFNTLIFELGDAVQFSNFPGKFFENSLTKDELLMFVQYARELGLNVIPEINLLTHQEKFFGKSRPDLMFNLQTYDPRKPEVYGIVYAYLDEVIALLHPAAILIGHDEVAGHNEASKKKFLAEDEVMLPAELFLQDVNLLHTFLTKNGIETMMWGDMLVSPDEFPSINSRDLNGEAQGYGRVLRRALPKDVTICDWHYGGEQTEFSTLSAFKAEGFHVLGSTWKTIKTTNNFSRYAAAYGADGMIATTWFHVQRKEWDVVERIIRQSGEAFSKDFPDAQ